MPIRPFIVSFNPLKNPPIISVLPSSFCSFRPSLVKKSDSPLISISTPPEPFSTSLPSLSNEAEISLRPLALAIAFSRAFFLAFSASPFVKVLPSLSLKSFSIFIWQIQIILII